MNRRKEFLLVLISYSLAIHSGATSKRTYWIFSPLVWVSAWLLALHTVVWETMLVWPSSKVILSSSHIPKAQGARGVQGLPLEGQLQLHRGWLSLHLFSQFSHTTWLKDLILKFSRRSWRFLMTTHRRQKETYSFSIPMVFLVTWTCVRFTRVRS